MLSVSYAGKNAYSAGKTGGILRGGASGANRGYVLAHCAPLVFPFFLLGCLLVSKKDCSNQKLNGDPMHQEVDLLLHTIEHFGVILNFAGSAILQMCVAGGERVPLAPVGCY